MIDGPDLPTATHTSQGSHSTHSARTRVHPLTCSSGSYSTKRASRLPSGPSSSVSRLRCISCTCCCCSAPSERGRLRGARAGCSYVRGMSAVVQTPCAPAGCALVPRRPLLPRPLLYLLRVILPFLASVIGETGIVLPHVVMYHSYLLKDTVEFGLLRTRNQKRR